MGRKNLLYHRWNDRKAALAASYRQKGRKFVHEFRKIKDLPDAVRDKAMSTYYTAVKKTYLTKFIKWLRRRESISKVALERYRCDRSKRRLPRS